ncbi:MAG: DNA recombination protein RmuC [Cellvibrionaceae bacterium]
MIEIQQQLLIAIGVAVLLALGLFFFLGGIKGRKQLEQLSLEKNTLEQQLTTVNDKLQQEQQEKQGLVFEKNNIENDRNALDRQLAAEKASGKSLDAQKADLEAKLQSHLSEAKVLNEKLAQLQAENARVVAAQDERDAGYKKQLESFEEQKQQLTKEFENLANRIFEDKGKAFDQRNKESLDNLLKPFGQQINDFKSRVESIHTEDTKAKASLSQELKNLRELNQQITEEAKNLTLALKGENKLQGGWGEIQAEKILESSGLKKDEEYEREANFKDEEGNNRRPDLIVHLPGKKTVIVDSKVSLVDYIQAVEAEDDASRTLALNNHSASIKKHINDLSGKDYSNLMGVNSPDFVLMFMPVEPAFMAAVEHDRSLFNYGYERNVILVTPTTLLPIVRTVANLWIMERSSEQVREVAGQANDLYNTVCTLAERLNKLGGNLATATKAYNSTVTALAGQQGVYPKVVKFKDLSAKATKELTDQTAVIPEIENQKLDGIMEQAREGETLDER